MDKKLDFFIVGVQKGGTTALYHKLTAHPDIFKPETKEIHFFDNKKMNWNAPDYSHLHSFFKSADESNLWGEATPIYMYWPKSIARLREYNPQAKIIISLRHPAFRALSHWKMETFRRWETLSFGDAVSEKGRRRFAGVRGLAKQLLGGAPNGYHRIFSYFERGLYASQIENVLNHFPRDQVFFTTTDLIYKDEDKVLSDLFRFLSVSEDAAVESQKVIRPVNSQGVDFDDWDSVRQLTQTYRSDIERTSKLSGLDLSEWLTDAYQERI